MKKLNRLQQLLILGICFVIPFIFTYTTAEFYITTKGYVVLWTALLCAGIFAINLMFTKQVRSVYAPFLTLLTLVLVSRTLTTAFATQNWVQSLFSLPTGGFIFLGMYLLYVFATYFLEKRSSHSTSLLHVATYGTLISAGVLFMFYFNPLQNTQLPAQLSFLKSQFSPMGNAIDSLILLGASALVLIYTIHVSGSRKHLAVATRNVAGLILIGSAVAMLCITIYKAPGTSFQLPPFDVSWYAALETLKTPKTALIGSGIDSFESLFTQVKPIAYNVKETWNTNYSLSRSALLHLWVETGLFGLVVIGLIIITGMRLISQMRRSHVEGVGLFVLLGLYVLGIWIALPITFMTLFVTILYLIDLSLVGARSGTSQEELHNDIHLNNYTFITYSIALLILIAVGAVGYFSMRMYQAEVLFKKSVDAISANDGKAVYDNLLQAVQLYPQNERFRGQFAQVNLLLANNIARKSQDSAQKSGTTSEKAQAGEDAKNDSAAPKLTDQERQSVAQFIQQAISEAKALVALNPQKASSWNTLAVIYRNVINVADGAQAWTVASYQEALRRDPLNPQLLLNLGGVYYGAKTYDLSTQTFQQAVLAKPNWANAHYNLAWSLYQQGNYSQASAVMNNVLQLMDKSSKDAQLARENLKMFNEKAKESSAPAQEEVKPVPTSQVPDVQPLELPATPEAVISPALQLPESSGPSN